MNFISHKQFVVIDKDLNTNELWYVVKNIQSDKFENVKINNLEYKKLSCESKLNYCKENYGCEYNYSKLQTKN